MTAGTPAGAPAEPPAGEPAEPPVEAPAPMSGELPAEVVAVRRTGGVVLAGALVLVGVGLLWSAAAAADGDLALQSPRLAPVVISVAWIAVAAAYLVSQVRSREVPPEEKPGWWSPAGVAASLVGFAIALEYAGFIVSAAVFVVVVARVLGSRHLLRDVIVAVLLPTAIFLVFTRLLDIFLPAGVLPL